MRLVVDKSRKKHIPSSRNCECIDFDNYIQGAYPNARIKICR